MDLALVVTVHLISLFGPYFNVTFHRPVADVNRGRE